MNRNYIIYAFGIMLFIFSSCSMKPTKPRLPFFTKDELKPEWIIPGTDISAFLRIGDMDLRSQDGQMLSTKTSMGNFLVVNFLGNHTEEMCSELLQNMTTVSDATDKDENIHLFTIALNANHNCNFSPATLKLINNRNGWWYLKMEEYKAESLLGHLKKRSSYEEEISPFEKFYLADRNGYIRGIYPCTDPIETKNLLLDIELLKAEDEN